jgi:hypothetical protein
LRTLRGFFVSAVSWRSSKSQYNVVKGQAFARLLCGGFINVHLFKTAPVVSDLSHDLSPKGIEPYHEPSGVHLLHELGRAMKRFEQRVASGHNRVDHQLITASIASISLLTM